MIPTFLINLDRSKNRLEEAGDLLRQAGIEFERVPAVDGSQFSDEDIARINPYPSPKGEWFRPLSKGEIGCFLSHLSCWKLILERKLPYALIFEDDIGLSPEYAQGTLEKILETEIDWDILKVARLGEKKKVLRKIDENLHICQCLPVPIDCTAYLVSLAGAEKLVQNREFLYRPVDFELKHYWERKLKVYSLSPNLFRQKSHEEVSSVIGARTAYRKYTFGRKAMVYLRKYRYHLQFFLSSQYHQFFD